MAYNSLNDYLLFLEKKGELKRITEKVSPELEITEIYDRIVKNNGPALLFENNGTKFPLAINIYGSDKRILWALGISSFEEVETPNLGVSTFKLKKINSLLSLKKLMPKKKKGKGLCQEIIMDTPDLSVLPIMKTWPFDGEKFITLPSVHTIDPETKIPNVGMYRMQVFDAQTTGMHWHIHKGSAQHYRKYKDANKKMPVSVTLGGDPVYTYTATAPLPENISEYILAGFLRKKAVKLVKCITNELFVPEDVDIVIEGYVDPNEELVLEGPFGDHTAYYSLEDYYPKFHITCITHRKNAIYPATVVGIPPQEDSWLGLATEKLFVEPLKLAILPEIIDMHLPKEGVFHNILLLKIKKQYPAHPFKVMNAIWGSGQIMFSKSIMVFDENVDLRDYKQVVESLSKVDIVQDIQFSKGPLDILDHTADKFAYGSKIGVDACEKNSYIHSKAEVNIEKLLSSFNDIIAINADLLNDVSSVLIISYKKKPFDNMWQEIQSMLKNALIKNVKYLLLVDEFVDVKRLNDVVWQVSGNMEPLRDIRIDKKNKILVINGLQKDKINDNFQRDCPNVIVMDDETIKKIDEKWDKLNLGSFIKSPSLHYKAYVNNKAARKE